MIKSRASARLLPLCLLAAFVLTAALTVLFGASVYRQILDRSNRLTEATALTYVTEKLHQSPGDLRVTRLGEGSALVLRLEAENVYDTYIYCHDGSLRELMIKAELEPAPEMGRPLLPMEKLELLPQGELLVLRLTCPGGEQLEQLICLRGREVLP